MSKSPPGQSDSALEVWPIVNAFQVRVKDIAYLFGVSRPAVSAWKDCPRNNDGTMNMRDVVQWRRDVDCLGDSNGGSVELELWRAARRKSAELDLAERRGELVEVANVEAEVSRMVVSFKQALLALPAAVAPRLEGLEAREISAVMTGEIERVLRDLKGAEND